MSRMPKTASIYLENCRRRWIFCEMGTGTKKSIGKNCDDLRSAGMPESRAELPSPNFF